MDYVSHKEDHEGLTTKDPYEMYNTKVNIVDEGSGQKQYKCAVDVCNKIFGRKNQVLENLKGEHHKGSVHEQIGEGQLKVVRVLSDDEIPKEFDFNKQIVLLPAATIEAKITQAVRDAAAPGGMGLPAPTRVKRTNTRAALAARKGSLAAAAAQNVGDDEGAAQ